MVVASGVALLVILGAAAAVIGAGVLLARRLTGRALPHDPAKRPVPPLEIAPDFQIFPASAAPVRENVAPSGLPRVTGEDSRGG